MAQKEEALKALQFEDDMCNMKTLPFISVAPLDNDRVDMFNHVIGPYNSSDIEILCAKYTNFDGNIVDHIIKYEKSTNTAHKVLCECGISMEEFSPVCIVQYQYEENGPWRLSKISKDPLDAYQKSKFSLWRNMLNAPTCQAAFVRMLKVGPINRIYDKLAFPIPETEQDDWVITDEKSGKKVDIPRPVVNLRIWNSTSNEYTSISPALEGAPSDADIDEFWKTTLVELRQLHGDEYITSLLSEC